MSNTISRVLYQNNHLSSPDVATRLKRPTRKPAGNRMLSVRSCFGWGLHSLLCYQTSGSLLHCHSTLTLTMSNTQNPVLLRHAVSQIAAQFSIHGIRRIHPRIHPVFSVSKLTRKSAESVSAHGSLLTRYLSVALSLESPPPDVIRHPAL